MFFCFHAAPWNCPTLNLANRMRIVVDARFLCQRLQLRMQQFRLVAQRLRGRVVILFLNQGGMGQVLVQPQMMVR